jgi:PTH1 family peptidyl-tRNA hydrolase
MRKIAEQDGVWMFVGLGNPGREYNETRHNVGFMSIQKLADHLKVKFQKKNYALIAETFYANKKVVMVMPQTFMNESGKVLPQFLNQYEVPCQQFYVVFDDMNLPLGKIRLRRSGSSGGHHGMDSIIEALGTSDFPRIRIGIGQPAQAANGVDYVLGKFSSSEHGIIDDSTDQVVKAIKNILNMDLEDTMQKFNGD